MKRIGAEYIISNVSAPIKNGVITVSDDGEIKQLESNANRRSQSNIEWYNGIIMPGMINAHCHLELSHLKNKIPSGTGLINFIGSVVRMRDFDQSVIQKAIRLQDSLMYNNGIVAVGDISNTTDTAQIKKDSPIYYHSFIEMFDLMQAFLTDGNYNQYVEVMNEFHTDDKHNKSVVPHASYSVSDDLFGRINRLNKELTTVCIHNQELWDEDELFKTKEGGFLDFYTSLDLNLDAFKATGISALQSILPKMDNRHRTILVHNTMTTKEDVEFAQNWGDIYWATCPNANLYIENKLPNYKMLMDNDAVICMGTDSLSSNWQLSIVEEMKVVYKLNNYISLDEIFKWATLNGAKALGIEDKYGSIEIGKKPGLVHLQMDWDNPNSFLSMVKYNRINL